MKISKALLKRIEGEALEAYPKEACGFLIGTASGDVILKAQPSPNMAKREDEFLVDSSLHLKLQRKLRAKNQVVIGFYHSHPSGDSHPSNKDVMGISGQQLVWMITSVGQTRPPETRIFSPITGKGAPKSRSFDENPLQISRFVA